jgi:hypothetical protein
MASLLCGPEVKLELENNGIKQASINKSTYRFLACSLKLSMYQLVRKMSKLISISATALILSCCTKEYTCECVAETGPVLSTHKTSKLKKSDAQGECNKICYQEHGPQFEGSSRVK